MDSVAGKSVTVTLGKGFYYNPYPKPPVNVGEMIKFKQIKRTWGLVTYAAIDTATLTAIYRPAPKSKLNKYQKSYFSKKKMKIVKIK